MTRTIHGIRFYLTRADADIRAAPLPNINSANRSYASRPRSSHGLFWNRNMNRRKFIIKSTLLLAALGFGSMYWKNRWKYIVVHHSAGSFGSIKFLQRVHRQRQGNDPIHAIPYHYVIGNGKGLAMGEIATDWRQGYNIWGAHVSQRNFDYNFRGIGICLIGNFENEQIPPKQYQSLIQLTRTLMSKYDILPENVTGHGLIAGESTKCPGKYFPMERLKKDIA